jgi:hypothetical protein
MHRDARQGDFSGRDIDEEEEVEPFTERRVNRDEIARCRGL